MKVTNHSRSNLGLPSGTTLVPGQCEDISEDDARNKIVSAWISRGLLVAGPPDAQESETPLDDKDDLIAKLAEQGIYRDRRTSIDNLRRLWGDVEAEDSESVPE